jgi:hypothetical protein
LGFLAHVNGLIRRFLLYWGGFEFTSDFCFFSSSVDVIDPFPVLIVCSCFVFIFSRYGVLDDFFYKKKTNLNDLFNF